MRLWQLAILSAAFPRRTNAARIGRVVLLVSMGAMAFGQQPDPKKIKQGIDSLRRDTMPINMAARHVSLHSTFVLCPPSKDKVVLADQLAHLSTEGRRNRA